MIIKIFDNFLLKEKFDNEIHHMLWNKNKQNKKSKIR